jgi:hypothetical protein
MTEVLANGPTIPGGVRELAATDGAAARATAPADSLAFRRLLESLEQIGRRSEPAPETVDAADLPAVLQTAEQDFAVAMDLRRRLESAFRARNP